MRTAQHAAALLAGGLPFLETRDAGEPVAELKRSIDSFMGAFEEFKKTNDQRLDELGKRGAADPLLDEKLTRINKSLDQLEPINQRLTAIEGQKKAMDEVTERFDALEKRLNRPGTGGNGDPRIERRQRVNLWVRSVIGAYTTGVPNLTDDQRKALAAVDAEYKAMSVTTDTTGGYLAPVEYVREIIKGVTEVSPARTIVRVRTTASKSIQIPKRTGQFAARRVSEQGARSETDGLRYGMVEIDAPEMYALVDISEQNLEDSAFDLESEVRMEATEQFAVKEGAEFVSGSGVGEMEGLLAASAGLSSTNSGSATTIADADGQANGMMTLFHALKTAYARDARWILNRVTLGSVRKLKDADKNYIWMPGLANGVPNTILGAPYTEMPDMPNEGANAFPIGFGDFRRGYTLLDRVAMSMLRDPYTQATAGNIRFLFRRRVGGRVVLAEAMRLLKCAS